MGENTQQLTSQGRPALLSLVSTPRVKCQDFPVQTLPAASLALLTLPTVLWCPRKASSLASIHPAQLAVQPALLTRPARSSVLTRIVLETVTATYSTKGTSPRLIFRTPYLRLVEGVTP